MTDISVDLLDPRSSLVPTTGSGGSYIDQLRDDCGYVIQGIDWVVRQINSSWDLIALIFDPIAGDFDGVRSVSANGARPATRSVTSAPTTPRCRRRFPTSGRGGRPTRRPAGCSRWGRHSTSSARPAT
jgi:hypothetical protein